MKLRRIKIQNVRSFLNAEEFFADGNLSIIIGPNGGGKTNLLDIISYTIRKHLYKSWTPVLSPSPDNPRRMSIDGNPQFNHIRLEKHSKGKALDQVIEIEVEVTATDELNMRAMVKDAPRLHEFAARNITGGPSNGAGSWTAIPSPGLKFTYTIVNDQLKVPSDLAAQHFLQYLEYFELDTWMRQEMGESTLSMPVISFPVNRGQQGFNTAISLAGYAEHDHKRSVDAASSKQPGNIVYLATARLAKKYRLLELDGLASQFTSDPSVQALKAALREVGYDWSLVTTDPMNNTYNIEVTKDGNSFHAGEASSGEKELLTYLFAIYALNVRDAVVLIDEPELHLHPRWQRTLLNLYVKLAAETGNQFIMATHSPTFVSPSSIKYVSRVFNRSQRSHIKRLRFEDLPTTKHLFSIVNSHNNERIFFADQVILVEGISDRIFFEAVFKKLGLLTGDLSTIELVSVGGKSYFPHYIKLLNSSDIPYSIIADLDYLEEVGNTCIKALFAIDPSSLNERISSPENKDHTAFVARLDEAIASGNIEDLRQIWTYLKSRSVGLKAELAEEEQRKIYAFIEAQRSSGVYILSRGALEKYLPLGQRSKDIEKLIPFIETDFWTELPLEAREELTRIVDSLRTRFALATC